MGNASDDWSKIERAIKGPTSTTAAVRESAIREQEKDNGQTRTLRYWIAGAVVLLLFCELWGLFMLIVWQGRGHFKLNEWMFGFLTNGVLLQTFFSLRTIITHLFPDGQKDYSKRKLGKPSKRSGDPACSFDA